MNGRPFTERELAIVRKLYPDKANITVDQIGERLGRNATSISKAAMRLGLTLRRKRKKRGET